MPLYNYTKTQKHKKQSAKEKQKRYKNKKNAKLTGKINLYHCCE